MHSEFNKLVRQASKTARDLGGLTSLLLSLKEKGGTTIKWDSRLAQFEVNGKQIPQAQVLVELSRIDLRIGNIVDQYNKKLFSGLWTLRKWTEEMLKLIDDGHMIFAALAVGGLAIAAASPLLARRRQRDRRYLRRYSSALRTGIAVPDEKESGRTLTASRARSRSRAYVRSLYVTFHLLWHRAHIAAGYKLARRILSPAEHCRDKIIDGQMVKGCLETARQGWIPIQEMPAIGTLVCKQFCKCRIQFRR